LYLHESITPDLAKVYLTEGPAALDAVYHTFVRFNYKPYQGCQALYTYLKIFPAQAKQTIPCNPALCGKSTCLRVLIHS